jgi:predicted metal-dependent enzyme (double-stranded beta helix superfamily)
MAQSVQNPTNVTELIQRLDRAVGRGEPRAICSGVKEALVDLARDHARGIPGDFFEEADDRYARRLLHRAEDGAYSVMIMVWAPGQGTAIHDHAGKWCVECVLRGQISITHYDPVDDPSSDPSPRFTEGRTATGHVGNVGVLVPPNEYHRIRNSGTETAATIHVYAGEMLWCHAFHDAGDGTWRRERCDLKYTD